MKNFYIAVTVKQDRNESIFHPDESRPCDPGYYSYMFRCSECDNLKSKLDRIGGLQAANICPTRKAARDMVEMWNDTYRANGSYLFDNPSF